MKAETLFWKMFGKGGKLEDTICETILNSRLPTVESDTAGPRPLSFTVYLWLEAPSTHQAESLLEYVCVSPLCRLPHAFIDF